MFVVMFFAAFLLEGCASMPKAAATKEGLMTTAEKYWKLRMEDKYEDAYKLEDRDGLPPFEDYQKRARLIKNFRIVSHSVGEIMIEGSKGVVEVKVNFILPPVPKPVIDSIHDEWIYKDGEWLHIFPFSKK
jgi:hypothetical protein